LRTIGDAEGDTTNCSALHCRDCAGIVRVGKGFADCDQNQGTLSEPVSATAVGAVGCESR